MKRKLIALLALLFVGVYGWGAPAHAESSFVKGLSTPDKESQMYLRGIPTDLIIQATVKNILNGSPRGIFVETKNCMDHYIRTESYQDVVRVILAAHPGVVTANKEMSLHETAEGQKVLFFCGHQMKKASPVVLSHLQRTMDQYIKLALNKTATSAIKG